ncbi:MAG: DUF2845 domain-containing protein [Leptothrix sp. (in: b-proteobacteria)]
MRRSPRPIRLASSALAAITTLTALVGSLATTAAQAESLRCNGHSVSEGDTRLSLLYQCGEPLLRDSRCAPVFVRQSPWPLPDALAAQLPCQPVEDWLYDRGPGNLMATVRLRNGVVLGIQYGQTPR